MHAHKVTFKRKKKLFFFIAFIAQFRNVYRSSIESRITIMWYIYVTKRGIWSPSAEIPNSKKRM